MILPWSAAGMASCYVRMREREGFICISLLHLGLNSFAYFMITNVGDFLCGQNRRVGLFRKENSL